MTEPHIVKDRLEERSTPIKSVEDRGNGKYKVTVEISGGYSLKFRPTDRYRVDHIVGTGDGEELTVWIEDKCR